MSARTRFIGRSSGAITLLGVAAFVMLSITGCGSNGSAPTQNPGAPASASTSQAGDVSTGAQLGLVWNPSDKTLRPVIGIPGSSWLGASLVPAGAYVAAAFSPATGIALLIDSQGNLSTLSAATQQITSLAQGVPANASIEFSPRGSWAAVYAPGSSSALLISGLPSQPAVSTMNAGSAIAHMTISDDGTTLIASKGSAGFSIAEITPGGSHSTVASVAGFGGMAFLPGSNDFLLADSVNNTLVRMHNGTAQSLATHTDGLKQPLAVAASTNGQWAVAINQANGTVLRVGLAGTFPTVRTTCNCSPSELLPLAGSAVFQLTSPSSASGKSPAWIFDADSTAPSVFFIPPTHSNTGSTQ